VVLGIAACLSIPPSFTATTSIGLDASWQLSLQWAAFNHKVFGREFVFTYGPLGYLFIHAAVNKGVLPLYDFFVLGSLLSVYRALLPLRPAPADAFLIIALSAVTKTCLLGPAAVLFNILGYWLWRTYERGSAQSVCFSLIAALVLFLGKVNYGLITAFVIPWCAIGMLLFCRERRIPALLLLLGFPMLVLLGAKVWHLDLAGYLHSGFELIAGYNEAMFTPPAKTLLAFELASVFLLAMGLAAWQGRHQLPWKDQAMILPFIAFASLLLFKNAFVRSDESHNFSFFAALPLLLAVWAISWRGAATIKVLLFASLLYPLALVAAESEYFGRRELAQITPWRYFREAVTVPWRESSGYLQKSLFESFPEVSLARNIRAVIGRSTVDVMPWESSIAVLNGLNYQPRPVPQAYSVYTPWLDELNARFLSSTNAPEYILFACAQPAAIDGRPAAWDESLTKTMLLENYALDSSFSLPLRTWPDQPLQPATVFLLRRSPGLRHLVPIATNQVSLALDQPLPIPDSTNLIYLALDATRSVWGKFKAAALAPNALTVSFKYQDGCSTNYRAVLPILKSGVLVNRRVESADETGNWLAAAASRNPGVSSITFTSPQSSAFHAPFKGVLIEYRLSENSE